MLHALAGIPVTELPSVCTRIDRLNIPSYLEDYVGDYSTWHQYRVRNLDPKFLIDEGVSEGTVKRFVSGIEYWVEITKRRRIEE